MKLYKWKHSTASMSAYIAFYDKDTVLQLDFDGGAFTTYNVLDDEDGVEEWLTQELGPGHPYEIDNFLDGVEKLAIKCLMKHGFNGCDSGEI